MKKFVKKFAIVLTVLAIGALALTAHLIYGKGYTFDKTVDTVLAPKQAISTLSAKQVSDSATVPGGAALGIVLTSDALIGVSITLVAGAALFWLFFLALPGKKAKEAKGDH